MSFDVLVAILVFASVSSVTPGPNNMMLMASGLNFGFYRTIPHMIGIELGFGLLLIAVGAGLGTLIHAVPGLSLAMKIVSVFYLLWLAWKIAFAKAAGMASTIEAQPIGFGQAAMFQLVNPKAWAMALVAMGTYVSKEIPVLSVAVITAAFMIVGIPSATMWTSFGVALGSFLASPKRLRIFNIVMGLLLVASLWPLLRG